MIQYVRILQEDSRSQKKKPVERITSAQNVGLFEKFSALKLVEQRAENIQSSKTPYQVIYELVRNNGTIFKQIFKFQSETEGVQLPEDSSKSLES